MIKRPDLLQQVRAALHRAPVVALLGPRQCGKTTLARTLVDPQSARYFDLEDPIGVTRLSEPMTVLGQLKGIIVIDEIQHMPELFPIIRVLADRRPNPAKFLILGSASPQLIKHSSESLAGRAARVIMSGFSLSEVGIGRYERQWLRGGFPRAFLARSEIDSIGWRKDFIQSFLERDLPAYGVAMPPVTLLRFWTMIAHYHAQIWNAAEPARSLGISEMTVKRYLDVLTGVFMVRQLQPWHANINKRQVKSPKVYICDSGILHYLLGIRRKEDLFKHPKCGASWEGYAIEEVIRLIKPDEVYFWAAHSGAEIDLIFFKRGKMYGIEFKLQDAPTITPSIKQVLKDLPLEHITVVYPGDKRYSLSEHVTVMPFKDMLREGGS